MLLTLNTVSNYWTVTLFICFQHLRARFKIPDGHNCSVYFEKCVEICWLAAVQDPSLAIAMDETEMFDSTRFRDYTVKGPFLDFMVLTP